MPDNEAPAFARPMRSQTTSIPHLLEREPELEASAARSSGRETAPAVVF
jgi:hypothetical protein